MRGGDFRDAFLPPPPAWAHACPGATLQAGADLTVKTAGAGGENDGGR